MTEISTIVGVSILAYLATNMDNFAILTMLFAKYRREAYWVVCGHLVTVVVVLLAAGAIGEAANVINVRYLGYLGVVPLAMGIYWAYQLSRPSATDDGVSSIGSSGAALGTTVVSMAANSTDTLLTQAIVFADTAARLDWVVAVAVFVAASGLAATARYSVENPRVGPFIERYANRVAPLIMIAVGLYVLANTHTDVVVSP
jgi:cadmium resistance protein CadD (predicted permease)